MDGFDVDIDLRGEDAVIDVRGDLNALVSGALWAHIIQTADTGRSSIIIDLRQVAAMDDAGARAIVDAAEYLAAEGSQLHVRGASEATRARLTRLGLD